MVGKPKVISVSESWARCFAAVSLALLLSAPMWGQTGANTGLRGNVSDPTGAAVPETTVTLLRTETGERRVVATNEAGDWEARALSPGTYQVTFECRGFKTLVREGITVSTAQVSTLDAQLQVGDVSESIEVVGNAEMVSASSATVVRTLDRRELESLPTSSRNFTQLLMIETGVSADISELLDNSNASISPSVNGARTTNNSFVYNGVDTTSLLCCNSRTLGGTVDSGGGSLSRNLAPAPETLEEVKLQTSLYDAATGRNGGGNFILVSKSGTNEFHGSIYHFIQNDKLMANEFFLNRAGVDRPVLRRNEGGATLGGPIIRNRTFFFGSFQLTRAQTSFVDSANKILRLPKALTDDRSDAGINSFVAGIWRPTSGPVNLSLVNPVSRELLKAQYPDGSYLIPSGANGRDCRKVGSQLFESCQVVTVIPATYRQNQFSASIDHQFTSSNRLSGKFFYTDQPSLDPLSSSRAISRFERNRDTEQRTVSLTNTHVISPAMVNEFRAGFFRNRNDTRPVAYFTNEQFGLRNPLASVRPDLVTMDIRGERDVGDRFTFGTYANDIQDVQNSFTYGDTLSWTSGRHSIKAGAEFRRHQLNGKLQELKNGRKNFRDWFAFLTVGYVDPGDGNRARQISDTAINYGETIRGYRMSDYSFFVANDWKVSPRLTLNLGVRWEYFGFPSEVNGFLTVFDYHAALATGNAQDGFIFASNFKPESIAGAAGSNLRRASTPSIVSGDKNNFMPRFGFAYLPFGSSRLVLRGGYGIFYERTTGAFANSLRQSSPFFREAQINDQSSYHTWPEDYPAFPIPQFIVGFSSAGVPSIRRADVPGTTFEAYESQMVDPNLATPYTQQWNLNAQWEFQPGWLWEFGYAGTKGTKLLSIYNINRAIDVDTVGFMPRPGPVPGGGLIGNYYGPSSGGVFVNLKTPPPTCNLLVNPSSCVVDPEVRSPLLGFDEDEGVNFLSSNANSIYNSFQSSLQKRFSQGYMFKVNYTFSRAIDTFSDEGKFQIEHDDLNPALNRGLADFHRKHRLISSGTWDLPFKGSRWITGWSLSGIATFQSGRPFSVRDSCCSGYLFPNGFKRPSIVPGATHADLATVGSVSDRVDAYLNRSAYVASGAQFGNLGRNTLFGPDQRRIDLSLAKITTIREGMSLELRGEFFNAFNTVTFREPDSAGRTINEASFGQITRTRGGPRVIQFGLKLKF
jgi:hypothetical protein